MRGVSTSTMWLTVLAGVAAIALAAPAAAPAAAGSIGVSAGTMLFQAGPLTTNRVTIERIPLPAGNVFYGAVDTGPAATIEVGTGCSLQAGAIRCGYTPAGTFVDVLRVRAILGDGDDTFV